MKNLGPHRQILRVPHDVTIKVLLHLGNASFIYGKGFRQKLALLDEFSGGLKPWQLRFARKRMQIAKNKVRLSPGIIGISQVFMTPELA